MSTDMWLHIHDQTVTDDVLSAFFYNCAESIYCPYYRTWREFTHILDEGLNPPSALLKEINIQMRQTPMQWDAKKAAIDVILAAPRVYLGEAMDVNVKVIDLLEQHPKISNELICELEILCNNLSRQRMDEVHHFLLKYFNKRVFITAW